MTEETKKCPYCREEIITDAIKCKHCGSMLPTPPTAPYDTLDSPLVGTPTAGDRIFSGRYRIIKELGRGGMGVVYLAHDDELDMDVAVKFLPVELANDRRALEQLRSEAKLSMTLTHDNIMRLHNLDTSGQFKFLVMEYVDGPSLLDVLREKERLPLEEALPIIKAICEGVDYAHSKRVLHRDLKPANIMLTSKGEVKVTDFGIARRMRDSMSKLSQKTISGTPAYMAPEHIMGEHITVRSDIYSLGAVVYELLSGHPPFYQGYIPDQIRTKEPSPISGIPDPINVVILKALAKNHDDRPASAITFYEALATIAERPEPEPVPRALPRATPVEEEPLSIESPEKPESDSPVVKNIHDEVLQKRPQGFEKMPPFLQLPLEERSGIPPIGSKLIADWTEAIGIDPNDAVAYYNRGIARKTKGDFDGAIADYSKAIEINPKFAEAYCNRGIARSKKADFDGAIADWTKTIELNPKFAEVYYKRGYARYEKGDLDGAIADWTKAIEINPNIEINVNYAAEYYFRGIAREEKGDLDGAIKDYSKAIEINPNYADAYYFRGDARKEKGDFASAVEDYEEFLRLAPNDALAKYAKQDIADLKKQLNK